MRVKPDRIRICGGCPDFWVLDGTTNEMRPYRLMIKEWYLIINNIFIRIKTINFKISYLIK